MSDMDAASYLAAMIDGEGCVGLYRPDRVSSRRVVITNTDPDIIDAVKRCCDALGISYWLNHVPSPREEWSDKWDVQIIRRDDIAKIAMLPIQSKKKRERLAVILASYKYLPPDDDRVVELYLEGRTLKQVGEFFGYSDHAILRILRRLDVPRRPRGTRALAF